LTDIWQSAVFWCHIKQTTESFDCGVVVVEVKQCIRIIILIYIKREKNIGKTSAGLFALISPHLPRHQLFCFQHGHLTTTKTISSTAQLRRKESGVKIGIEHYYNIKYPKQNQPFSIVYSGGHTSSKHIY